MMTTPTMMKIRVLAKYASISQNLSTNGKSLGICSIAGSNRLKHQKLKNKARGPLYSDYEYEIKSE